MAIKQELLEILRCPAPADAGDELCKQPLDLIEVEAGQGLRCQGCGRVYPIRDDIPVMLVEEATTPSGAGD